MKKSILILAVVTLGFAACTSNVSTNSTTDSTVVDSTAVTAVDSTVAEIPVVD